MKIKGINKFMLLNDNIQSKLLRWIIPFMTLCLIGLGVLVFEKSYQMQENSINSLSLQIVNSRGDQVGEWISSLTTELQRVAERPNFQSMDWNRIEADLGNLHKERADTYGLMFMLYPDGSYYIPGKGLATKKLNDRSYFKDVFEKKMSYSVTDPSMSKSTGEKKFNIAVPVTRNGEVVGCLAVNVNLTTISNIASHISIGKSGYGFICDSKGLMVAHPNQDYVMQFNLNASDSLGYSGFKQLASEITKTEQGTGNITDPSGNDIFIIYSSIVNSPGWTLAVAVPKTEIFAEIYSFLTLVSLVFLLTLAILISLIWFLISRIINRPLDKLITFTEEIAEGKLYAVMEYESNDEVGRMASALMNMKQKLLVTIGIIQKGAGNIERGGSEIRQSSEQIATGANQQASASEEISSSMEQMVANINQNTDNAKHTESVALEIARSIDKVGNASEQSLKSINIITEKIKVIGEIAERTDLLAINAAIEAARAGTSGKGFSVVASEVRNLAEKSQQSAVEIDGYSHSSVEVTKEATKLLEEIMPNIQKNASLVREITAASLEQLSGAEQINKAIQEFSSVTQQNSASSEELASSSEELATQAKQLTKAVAFFKLSEAEDLVDIEDIETQANKLFDVIRRARRNQQGDFSKLEKKVSKELNSISNKPSNSNTKGFNIDLNSDNGDDGDYERF